jgi:hypothetical protein
MPKAGKGGQPESVLLGCLLNEHLRLWCANGKTACVRVLDPDDIAAAIAHGIAPRTSLQPGRFREAGRYDPAGALRITEEFPVEVAKEPRKSKALWAAATAMFQDAAVAAIARGEFLVLEPGGWESTTEPYARAGARRVEDEWTLYAEALPSPTASSWPEPRPGQAGWGVAAPAEPETLAALGGLLTDAVAAWAKSPFDVALTFGKSPDGPWSPDD